MKPPWGGSTAREAMLTMRPPPPAIMPGSTARQAITVEVRLSFIIRSHSASGVDTRSPPAKPPTALTRPSTRPCRSWTACTNLVTAASSVTSAATGRRRARSSGASRPSSAARSSATA